MEGEDRTKGNIIRDGDFGGGGCLGIGLNQGVGSLWRQIPIHYWWKWKGKARCRAVSAWHVTLIDTALAVAQPPVRPGLLFQFAPWFIYRDTGLNNHWGGSGLFVVSVLPFSVLPCPLKGMAGFNLEYQEKESSCCKRCSVHVRTNFEHILTHTL